MKDMGNAAYVLGIEIHRDRSKGILGLSQRSYISKVLERFGMQNCSPGEAPIVKGDKLSLQHCPKNELERKQMASIPYASAVGSLQYAQTCTRPDISYAVGMLGRYQSNPGMAHWRAAKKVMRYLQGTKDYMLTYRRSDNLEVVGYSDADFGGCQDSRKSTTGYVFLLACGAISWRSIKQTTTAAHTMEAELIALYETSSQAIWIKNFITGLKVVDSIERPIKIYCDNEAAFSFSNNNKSATSCRHLEIKYFVVKERTENDVVSITHVGTLDMLADPLTKGLAPGLYSKHVRNMGLLNDCV